MIHDPASLAMTIAHQQHLWNRHGQVSTSDLAAARRASAALDVMVEEGRIAYPDADALVKRAQVEAWRTCCPACEAEYHAANRN